MLKAINILPQKNVHGVHEYKILLIVFNCTETYFLNKEYKRNLHKNYVSFSFLC